MRIYKYSIKYLILSNNKRIMR
uniref:Uncharacterized protein n=1 Tax=Heterorhabditis bacteriophora TaxID=37862 RepID=A0A1I7WKT6_HETBA